MARSKVHGAGKSPKTPAEKLLEDILDDVLHAMALPHEEWRRLWSTPFASMAIPAGNGTVYPCTQAGANAAHKLTAQTWDERADLRQTVAREAFDRLSFTAVGQTIRISPRHIPANPPSNWQADDAFYAAMAADYAANLDALTTASRSDLDRHIPCHLFDVSQGVAPFAVGPVAFLPRIDWIRKYAHDPTLLKHLEDVEGGVRAHEDLHKQAMAGGAPSDVMDAWSVLTFLGGHSWVATIRMQAHEPTQSHRKASVFVGLAIDLIGLRFHLDDARRLTKAGRAHLFHEGRLATDVNGTILRGGSAQMAGLGGKPGALAAKIVAEQPFLDDAGKVLAAFVDARNSGKAPHLIERWANALYWFGEARREASDFMAVVDYGCAADGFSNAGGASKDMIAFAEAALNPRSDPTPPGALSIRDAVTRVYTEGRNKLAHGEESGLFEDVTDTRRIGDELMVALLDVVTPALAHVLTHKPNFLTVPEDHAYRALMAHLRTRS